MDYEKKVSFQLLTLITTPKLAEKAAEMFKKGALPLQYRFNAEGTAASGSEQSLPRNAGTEKSCLPHLPKRQSRKMSDMSTTSAAPSISAQTSMKSCPLMMSV